MTIQTRALLLLLYQARHSLFPLRCLTLFGSIKYSEVLLYLVEVSPFLCFHQRVYQIFSNLKCFYPFESHDFGSVVHYLNFSMLAHILHSSSFHHLRPCQYRKGHKSSEKPTPQKLTRWHIECSHGPLNDERLAEFGFGSPREELTFQLPT